MKTLKHILYAAVLGPALTGGSLYSNPYSNENNTTRFIENKQIKNVETLDDEPILLAQWRRRRYYYRAPSYGGYQSGNSQRLKSSSGQTKFFGDGSSLIPESLGYIDIKDSVSKASEGTSKMLDAAFSSYLNPKPSKAVLAKQFIEHNPEIGNLIQDLLLNCVHPTKAEYKIKMGYDIYKLVDFVRGNND